jgi:hypothetical protein
MTSDKVLDEMVELQDEITDAMPFRDLATLRLARKIVCDGALPYKAAPKLLAALCGMLEAFVESDQLGDYEDMAAVKAARTAIRAATRRR